MNRITLMIFLTLLTPAFSGVRLPNVFTDHMVLQRDRAIRVWGWADPGEKIKVVLAGGVAGAVADKDGGWKLELPAMPAGGPHEMTVTGTNTVHITDILLGEVWVCSGQSNMEYELKHALHAQEEIQNANHPKIRILLVPRTSSALPLDDVNAHWSVCAPDNPAVANFSAVAYFFGREIFKELDVPVGLIAASQGATQIEPWTAPEGLTHVPALHGALAGIEATANAARAKVAENLNALEAVIPAARAALANGRPMPRALAMPSPMPNEGGPVLYNGMIFPLVPYGIRGALWYQGESNCGDGTRYLDKMKALVAGWRHVWGQGDFPFYYVQITPNNYNGALPFLLEAQNAAMAIPNTGMAATTDTCKACDGHPANKQEVGRRLALWALAKTYGRNNLVYCGPQYRSLKVDGRQLRVTFDSVGGGLVTRDHRAPDYFEIAGADGRFVDAEARIDGASVVIQSDEVASPVAMRFAWKDLAQPNLMNREGLPVATFRASLGALPEPVK